MVIRKLEDGVNVARVVDAERQLEEPRQRGPPPGRRGGVLVDEPGQVRWPDEPEAAEIIDKGEGKVASFLEQAQRQPVPALIRDLHRRLAADSTKQGTQFPAPPQGNLPNGLEHAFLAEMA